MAGGAKNLASAAWVGIVGKKFLELMGINTRIIEAEDLEILS
jgi:hypothetical protein